MYVIWALLALFSGNGSKRMTYHILVEHEHTIQLERTFRYELRAGLLQIK